MAVEVKWYKTTGGKVGIVALIGLAATAIIVVIRANSKPKQQAEKMNEVINNLKDAADKGELNTLTPHNYDSSELPQGGKGCGDVKGSFDRVYNYIKCDGTWWTISKDKVKIPTWKSLADNKTATDLLNSKYPN